MARVWQSNQQWWKETVLSVVSGLDAVGAKLQEPGKPQLPALPYLGWTGLWVTYSLKHSDEKNKHIFNQKVVWFPISFYPTVRSSIYFPSATVFAWVLWQDFVPCPGPLTDYRKGTGTQRNLSLAEPCSPNGPGGCTPGVTPGTVDVQCLKSSPQTTNLFWLLTVKEDGLYMIYCAICELY